MDRHIEILVKQIFKNTKASQLLKNNFSAILKAVQIARVASKEQDCLNVAIIKVMTIPMLIITLGMGRKRWG